MADFLVRRWRLREVLGPYLYTCILDLNGANNIGGFRNDPEILKQHPPFDPALASLAPAALDQVARIAKTLVLGKEELRSIVEERSAKLPLSADQSWAFGKGYLARSLVSPEARPRPGEYLARAKTKRDGTSARSAER
jgi:hypothetical protein